MGRAFSVGFSLVLCSLVGALSAISWAVPGYAQTPAAASAPSAVQTSQSVVGFVSPYEITKIAMSAGFDPLAPPMREGTTYVLRATDFRGILMRVVIDARTGAIRDANRIVPGPGRYGQYGMVSPYESADLDPLGIEPPPTLRPPPALAPLPPAFAAPSHAGAMVTPPLPRPRPAALKPPAGSEASNAAPPAPPAAPQGAPVATKKPAVVEPLND